MKRFVNVALIGIALIFLFFCLLTFVRYVGARKRLLPSGYRVEIHRDNFYFFGMPGSGGDMQGFCKVIPPDNRSEAAYFYLEMTQFESEINDDTIKMQGGRIVVHSPMVKPMSENIWKLLFF